MNATCEKCKLIWEERTSIEYSSVGIPCLEKMLWEMFSWVRTPIYGWRIRATSKTGSRRWQHHLHSTCFIYMKATESNAFIEACAKIPEYLWGLAMYAKVRCLTRWHANGDGPNERLCMLSCRTGQLKPLVS